MTGDLLARIGRVILHEDTFELMAAPAIADLQLEPSAGAYAAVWSSLLGGFADDFWGDIRLVVDDFPTLATLVGIQAGYYSCMLMLLVAHMRTPEALRLVAGGAPPQFFIALFLIFTISTLPTLLCFWPSRRGGADAPQLQQ